MAADDDIILVDTKGVCFICLKWVTSLKTPSKGDQFKVFSYRTLARYLCLNLQKVFDMKDSAAPTDFEKTANFNVKLCPDCYPLANQFAKLYKEKEQIRLKMAHCDTRINEIMIQAGRVRSRVKHYKKLMIGDSEASFDIWIMENLRKETMERCVAKLRESIPKVLLVGKRKSSMPVINQKPKKFEMRLTTKSEDDSLKPTKSIKLPDGNPTEKDAANAMFDKFSNRRNSSTPDLEKISNPTNSNRKHRLDRRHSLEPPAKKQKESSSDDYLEKSSLSSKLKKLRNKKENLHEFNDMPVLEPMNEVEPDFDRPIDSSQSSKRGRKKLKKKHHHLSKLGRLDSTKEKTVAQSQSSGSDRKLLKSKEFSLKLQSNEKGSASSPVVVGSSPVKRGRGRPRKLKTQQSQVSIKPLSISLPRLARTVVSKYIRDTRSRAQDEKDKSAAVPDSSNGQAATTQPSTIAKPGGLFSCHFCAMKFYTATEVKKHCSKFHYCQLFFSSMREPNEADEEFRSKIDAVFDKCVRKKSNKFGCPYCLKLYVQMRHIRTHVAETHYNDLKDDFYKHVIQLMDQKLKNIRNGINSGNTVSVEEKTNNKTKQSQCEYCDQKFAQNGYLRLHTARSHCDQLFASFKSTMSEQSFNEAIEKVFDDILSLKTDPRKQKKCALCPTLQLGKSRCTTAHWKLHVINKHFQEFGKKLNAKQPSKQGQQNPNQVSSKRKSSNHDKNSKSNRTETKPRNIVVGGNEIPEYIQNIGSSVDKNGCQTEFYYCCLCKKTIDGMEKLAGHKLIHEKSSSPGKKTRSIQCKYCSEKFESSRAIQQHSVEYHCFQLLSPYRNPQLTEKGFHLIVEQNFTNLLQQIISDPTSHVLKCSYSNCYWNCSKDREDAIKQVRSHLIVDHFDNFTTKLVELQKEQENEMGAASGRNVEAAVLVSSLMQQQQPASSIPGFFMPFPVQAPNNHEDVQMKSDVVNVDVTDNFDYNNELYLMENGDEQAIDAGEIFQYHPVVDIVEEEQPIYLNADGLLPNSNP